MESLIKFVEDEISYHYSVFRNNPKLYGNVSEHTPDRHSKDFVERCLVILTLELGFAEGSRKVFEIKEYLERQNGTHN